MNKEALIHYSGYILSSIGALFGVSLLSHIVTADMYGTIALYIAIATLFQTIVREALSNALMRYASEIQKNKVIALSLIKTARVPIIICYVAICIFCYFWVDAKSYTELILSFLLILFLGFTVAGEAFLSAVLNRGAYAIHLNIIQWLRFPLAAIFFYYFNASTSSILVGFILAFLIAAIFDFLIWKSIRTDQPKQNINPSDFNIFSGYMPIWIGLFVWFTTFYDRLAIEKIHGEDLLGIYFVLIQIAYMPIIVLMRASANFLFPLLYNQNKKVINKKSIFFITSLFFLVWLFLQFTHQWLFSWLVGEQYREYSWLLSWLFLAAVLNAAAYLFQARFYQAHTMKTLVLIRGLTALFHFATVTLLAWLYAIEGLVFANVCASIFLIALSWYFGRGHNRIDRHNT
jgi:O-antigen/teichoic acid export membrane protein